MYKKIKLLCLFVLSVISVNAQQFANFQLQPDGSFKSEDSKGFIVIPFEGKTAAQLYNMVKENVMKNYNSPKEVMTENEPQSISIHGRTVVANPTITLIPRSLEGYYTIYFQFKDGRIRIDAPAVNDKLSDHDGYLMVGAIPSFSSYTEKLFKKDGTVKKKDKKEFTENSLNSIINLLLKDDSSADKNSDW